MNGGKNASETTHLYLGLDTLRYLRDVNRSDCKICGVRLLLSDHPEEFCLRHGLHGGGVHALLAGLWRGGGGGGGGAGPGGRGGRHGGVLAGDGGGARPGGGGGPQQQRAQVRRGRGHPSGHTALQSNVRA